MSQTKPINEIQRELRGLLVDDLAAALKALETTLPEHSDKYSVVLSLTGRLNDTNKKRLRNLLSNDELQREYDRLRADLMDLINAITEADFEAAAPKSATAPGRTAPKQGSVLYRVPHVMPLLRETKCVVRVSVDEDAIVENITLDEHVALKTLSRIANLMQVELCDPSDAGVFKIRSASTPEQIVDDYGYTEWFFYVTPLREGVYPLNIKIAAIELVYGRECKKEIVLDEEIRIVTEAPASDDAEAPMKSAGTAFAFEGHAVPKVPQHPWPMPQASAPVREEYYAPPAVSWEVPSPVSEQQPPVIREDYSTPPAPASHTNTGYTYSLRIVAAFFIALLVLPAGAWAFATPETRYWVVVRYVDNSAEAYTEFINTYPDSERRETATFRKALKTHRVSDFREYQQRYGDDGDYRMEVVEELKRLELEQVQSIQEKPEVEKIRQFVIDFPESERLPAIKQVVEQHPELRDESQPLLERAYVQQIRQTRRAENLRQYLRDFPQSDSINTLADVAASDTALLQTVQPDLEARYIQRIKERPIVERVVQYLDHIQTPTQLEDLEETTERYPALRQKPVQTRIQAAKKRVEQRKEQVVNAMSQNQTQQTENDRLAVEERKALIRQDSLKKVESDRLAAANLVAVQKAENDRLAEEKRKADERAVQEAAQKNTSKSNSTFVSKAYWDTKMKPIPAGTFVMGDDKDDLDNNPTHRVQLSFFQLSKTEVTFEEYDAFCEATNRKKPEDGGWGRGKRPVINVNWFDAVNYCNWLSTQLGLEQIYTISGTTVSSNLKAKGFRLPTEAEWEYAARSGAAAQDFEYAGSNDIKEVSWFIQNSNSKTQPVGGKKANALGLYDMSGNVWEWCWDWYDEKYYEKPSTSATANPQGANKGMVRVNRGGSWGSRAGDSRSTGRNGSTPSFRADYIGFRVARQ